MCRWLELCVCVEVISMVRFVLVLYVEKVSIRIGIRVNDGVWFFIG